MSIDKRGPIFDGRAEKAFHDAANSVEKEIATIGASMIRSEMDSTFRTQTPFYRLKNIATPEPPGWAIHDQGVVYGPWLEGTGSRNPTARFKGYSIYRRSVARITAIATNTGKRIIVQYMGRMQ